MADEVTKKDLKALQNDYNKQIADVKKELKALDDTVGENRHSCISELDEENKLSVSLRKDLDKRGDDTQNSINTLAKAISELATRVQKLEKGR